MNKKQFIGWFSVWVAVILSILAFLYLDRAKQPCKMALIWEPCTDYFRVEGYLVSYASEHENKWNEIIVNGRENTRADLDLKWDTCYFATVKTIGFRGIQSEHSRLLSWRTPKGPPKPPKAIRIE